MTPVVLEGEPQLTIPPDGFRWEWVLEDETGPHAWRVVDETEGLARRCRAGAGPHHPACGRPSVAAFNRGISRAYEPRRDCWWHYCLEHLYGRRVRAGHVEVTRLVPIGHDQ